MYMYFSLFQSSFIEILIYKVIAYFCFHNTMHSHIHIMLISIRLEVRNIQGSKYIALHSTSKVRGDMASANCNVISRRMNQPSVSQPQKKVVYRGHCVNFTPICVSIYYSDISIHLLASFLTTPVKYAD